MATKYAIPPTIGPRRHPDAVPPFASPGRGVCRWCLQRFDARFRALVCDKCRPEFKHYYGMTRIWAYVRGQVLRRDESTCQLCGHVGYCEVDHIVPRVRGGNDDPSNLRCLCVPCHKRETVELNRCLTNERRSQKQC